MGKSLTETFSLYSRTAVYLVRGAVPVGNAASHGPGCSDVDLQAIIGQVYVSRKFLRYVPVFAHLMADMCEVGMFGADFLHHADGFLQREVADMVFPLERIQYNDPASFYFFDFGIGDEIGIGDVSKIFYPEAQYR